MNTYAINEDETGPADLRIFDEANDWLIRLDDPVSGPDDPYHDVAGRNQAFLQWLGRSATHRRIFMDALQLESRILGMNATDIADIQRMIEARRAEESVTAAPEEHAATAAAVNHQDRSTSRRWAVGFAIAAGCVAVALLGYYRATSPVTYVTLVGERTQQTLPDKSVIELNGNSQVEVLFSKAARKVQLVRGEAFFDVAHDPSRPFTVTTRDLSVEAIGTQFNVFENPYSVSVAVIRGRVRGAGASFPQPVELSEGQMATIYDGKVDVTLNGNVKDVTSWRSDRLEFHHARLVEVAEQLNLLNSIKIRVEGRVAQETRLSARFQHNDYKELLGYALSNESLSVSQDGNDWVIRARQ